MKKAVIYARYSSDKQREESIEGQIRECNRFAENEGITVINTYIGLCQPRPTIARNSLSLFKIAIINHLIMLSCIS